jgi:hypothetical protein
MEQLQNCYLYRSKYGDLVQRGVLDLPLSQTPEIQITAAATFVARARPIRADSKFCAPALDVINVQPATSQLTPLRALSQQERRAE